MAAFSGCTTLGVHTVRLPNVGREGHSWLTYIQTGVFAPINVFLQGQPHGPWEAVVRAHTPSDAFSLVVPPVCGGEYADMPAFHDELMQIHAHLGTTPTGCYSYFGQFVASHRTLELTRTRHAAFIEEVLMPALEKTNDPMMGHALERMWMYFLVNPPP